MDLKVPGSSTGGGGKTTKINRSFRNQCYDLARPDKFTVHSSVSFQRIDRKPWPLSNYIQPAAACHSDMVYKIITKRTYDPRSSVHGHRLRR